MKYVFGPVKPTLIRVRALTAKNLSDHEGSNAKTKTGHLRLKVKLPVIANTSAVLISSELQSPGIQLHRAQESMF